MKPRQQFILLAVVAFVTFSQQTLVRSDEIPKIKISVTKYVLPNGLTVLLHQDRTSPLVSYHTWFRVGSKDEEVGFTGMAHLFEHMMFKGAKRYDGKSFDRILAASGASHNAFTTRDYTAYHATLPSNKLELIMDLESDRMESLQITEEHLTSEREVVKEERRYRVDENPMGVLNEATYSTAFKVHPYRWPVIGYMEDLGNITVQKCKDFFARYYAPRNAVLVIAGDFDLNEAKRLIQKYYGHIPSKTFPPNTLPTEPEQKSMRQENVSKNVQNESLAIVHRTVSAGDKSYYALDILASVLGDGNSSRLYRKLVYEKQVATGVGVSHSGAMGPGLFQIVMQLKPGSGRSDALKITYAELWDARNKKLTPRELQKARNQVVLGYVGSLRTVHGKAMSLAYNEVVMGSYENLFKDLDRYFEVTAEDVKRAAEQYLNPSQRNLIVVAKFQPPKPNAQPSAGDSSDE